MGLPIIAFVLLWWAEQQFIDLRNVLIETRGNPPWWSVLGWMFTLFLTGVLFGLAASLARTGATKSHWGATIVVGILPLAVALNYFAFYALGWIATGLDAIAVFLLSYSTVTVSCVVVGFLVAGLFAHRLVSSNRL